MKSMSMDGLAGEKSTTDVPVNLAGSEPSGRPMFFGSTGRELFGWFHGDTCCALNGLGLVICGSLGAEEVAAQRTLLYLAKASAAAGIPCLRFDYPGCGHSTGSDDEPNRVAAWVASVHVAVDALKREAGVNRVALLGLRAGVLMAATAAMQRNDIDSLVAMAPPANGRALLREWKILAQTRADARRRPMTGSDSELEAGGFWFSRETCDALSQIDLLKFERSPADKVLVVDRDDVPVGNRWTKHLLGQGVQVDTISLVGYSSMLEEPQRAEVPAESVARLVQWLQATGGCTNPVPNRTEQAVPNSNDRFRRDCAIVLPSPVAGGSPVVERTVHVAADGADLFGVVSSPLTTPAAYRNHARKGILLLAHGATRCLGPGRMYVPLARRWAALGNVVLRLDLSGIGDSSARNGQPEHVIYSPSAARDVAYAIEYMRTELGVQECEAIGVCSGAYHAFKAAVAGNALGSVIAVNPAVFFWEEGMSLDVLPEDMVTVRSIAGYRRSIRSAKRWRKWLRGEVNLMRTGSMIARRIAMSVKRYLRDVARWAGIAVSNDLAAELRSAVAHQGKLRFIFSPSESGLTLLREQAGASFDRLRRDSQIELATIADADHNFSSRDARIRLSAMLDDLVGRERTPVEDTGSSAVHSDIDASLNRAMRS
jgi:pimeloyl-ACP methyl ester carboxylesterase